MASARRTRNSSDHNPFYKRRLAEGLNMELLVPTHFRCPISLDIMKDPVTMSTGITYDRQSIEMWLDMGNSTCPVTNQELTDEELIPNHSIRRMIQDWCVANRSYGIERIPTPRIPATPIQVSEILSEIVSATQRGDHIRCRELCMKLKALAKESERNRKCVVSAGSGRVLAASFGAFSGGSLEASIGVLEETLSALAGLFPLDEEACWHIGSPESLNSIVSITNNGDLAGRLNAVLVLKELLSCNKELPNIVAGTEGLIEALVELIRHPISPYMVKASLLATFYLVSSNEKTATMFAEMGLVPLLIEILVESEKSTSEKALAVFDAICGCERGREKAYGHALTVPVLVKKMFRVSDMATELAVSALWKLCKNYKKEEEEGGVNGCLVEALQVGAFQKLLLLLQVGCSGAIKEKATDLLKLLNGFKGGVECIDSLDFKGLKTPY